MPGPDKGVEAAGRLEAFAARVERLPIDLLPALAVPADERDRARARRAAMAAAETAGLGGTIREARGWITDWTLRVYASWQYQPTFAGLNWGRSMGRPDDRTRVAETLADAVVAVALGDALDAEDRAALLGGWAGLLDPEEAIEGEEG